MDQCTSEARSGAESESTTRLAAILAAGYLRLRASSSQYANGPDHRPNLTPCPTTNCLAIGASRKHELTAATGATRFAQRS